MRVTIDLKELRIELLGTVRVLTGVTRTGSRAVR